MMMMLEPYPNPNPNPNPNPVILEADPGPTPNPHPLSRTGGSIQSLSSILAYYPVFTPLTLIHPTPPGEPAVGG